MPAVVLLAFGLLHLPLVSDPVFTSPSGLVFNQVLPDKTTDFEQVATRLRAALRTSSDPTRRKQGEGLRIYKAEEPYDGLALYVFVVDPAVPSADYSITRILAESYPAEVQDLYAKFRGACVSQTFWNMTPVASSPAR
jgi:hypothetical protein